MRNVSLCLLTVIIYSDRKQLRYTIPTITYSGQNLMSILTQYGKEIFSVVVPVFTLLLNKFFKNRAKISFGKLHQYSYLIDKDVTTEGDNQPKQKVVVHTESYVFNNEGREPATSLEIIFNYKPMYLNIWPSRHYTIKIDPDQRYIMMFDYLAPKESITCALMSVDSSLPNLLSVRCKEGLAECITIIPQKRQRPMFINFVGILIFMGSISLVYFVIVLLQWLLLKTG